MVMQSKIRMFVFDAITVSVTVWVDVVPYERHFQNEYYYFTVAAV